MSKRLFLSFMVIFILVINVFGNEKIGNLPENKVVVYGKLLKLTEYPKLVLGFETVDETLLQIVDSGAVAELEKFIDKYLTINGYLQGSSIFTKYSVLPDSWNEITKQEFDDFTKANNKVFNNIRWESTKTKRWAKFLKNLKVKMNNNLDENISVVFVEMDILGLPNEEKKRWYFGMLPDIIPSRNVNSKQEFEIIWKCDKLDFLDDEEMKYNVKIAYLNSKNVLVVNKFASQNKWCQIWKSE